MKIKLAILEKDTNYLKRIANALENDYSDRIQLYSYTDDKIALDELENNRIDVFLANEEFKIDIDKIYKRTGFAYLSEDNNLKELRDCAVIGKYQKIEIIYKSILNIYAEKSNSDNDTDTGNDFTPIHVFISAGGGSGSSVIAASTAVRIARSGKKPLYINMERFGNSELYFSGEGNGSFSEIIYALKSKKGNLKLKLEGNIKTDSNGVDFFGKCNNSLDIMELTSEDIKLLFGELKKLSQYDCVIIDTNLQIDEVGLEMLHAAKQITVVCDGSEIANDKFTQIYTTLGIIEQQKDMRIISKIALLYNKFRNRTSTMLSNDNIKVIGGIQMFEGCTLNQLVEEISKMDCLNRILE